MGLLDVLNGIQNGPRGKTDPNSKGGMSPITMAILALLAYKGIKHFGGNEALEPAGDNIRIPSGNTANAGGGDLGSLLGSVFGTGERGAGAGGGPSGGFGDLLKGGLGGLLAGGAVGSVLSGGLGGLLNQLQQDGHGEVVNSWIGKGPNQNISESDLAKSIGSNEIEALIKHTGLSRQELLSGLSRELPEAVDKLTPNGRVPTAAEVSRWV